MEERSEQTDAELLRRAAGSGADAEAAFETLYFRHRDFAVRVARRFARDENEAMDAVQEAFVYLARNVERFARPGALTGRLTTLLYPAVKNSALRLARKGRRLRFGEVRAETTAAVDDVASLGIESAERRAGLAAAVEGLPEAQREVLLMRIVDGLSVAEVAAALGVPEGTVKSRLFHGVAALREDPRTRAWFDGP